jgi:hypothetical protein
MCLRVSRSCCTRQELLTAIRLHAIPPISTDLFKTFPLCLRVEYHFVSLVRNMKDAVVEGHVVDGEETRGHCHRLRLFASRRSVATTHDDMGIALEDADSNKWKI